MTPIQEKSIPFVLQGKDLLGIAQTGTGKTAAFSLPMIQLMLQNKKRREPKRPRALILTPTRELALQIFESLESYGKDTQQKYAVVFGGVGQGPQVEALRRGVDVIVATPGRLLDLLQQKHIDLGAVEYFVLDEADRMLDMGFIRDVQKILPHLPVKKQSLFFSATMPSEIKKLSDSILSSPLKIEIAPQSTTTEQVRQSVYFVEKEDKLDLLLHLLKSPEFKKVLIFVEMKHTADRLADKLEKNRYSVQAIHGNKSQTARQRAIKDFESNKLHVLVATDIVARGLDFEDVSHVINFELSNVAETYVHRIGRTGRASHRGDSISFCNGEEKSFLFAIQKTIQKDIPVVKDHPYHSESAMKAEVFSAKAIQARRMEEREAFKRKRRGSGGGGGRSSGGSRSGGRSSGRRSQRS